MIALVGALALLPLPAGRGLPGTGAATYANPVVATDFPDPFVLRHGSTYYAYGTNAAWGNVPVMQSDDLVTWTLRREALPLLPAWARPGFSWAPSVLAVGGRFVLYYTARERSTGLQCVSRAVALHPAGPFHDDSRAPLVCRRERGGAIDPQPVVDGDRSLWLLYKTDDNVHGRPTSIWAHRLRPDGLALGQPAVEVLRADQAWEQGIVESPAVLRHGGRYHLFYSGGRWDTPGYAIGHAVCERLTGPCHKTSASPMVTASGSVAGPGGQSVFRDGSGRPWMAYHAWDASSVGYPVGRRALHIDRLEVRDGRPVLHGPSRGPVPLHGTPDRPAVAIVPSPTGLGYRLVADDGDVFVHGDARFHGGGAGGAAVQRFVAAAAPAGTDGYWLVTRLGRVHAFGTVAHHGDLSARRLDQPVAAIVPSRTGLGYWLVDRAGVVTPFGDAASYGDLRHRRLAEGVVAAAPAASGHGYWLVDRLGRVTGFGDARHHGDLRGRYLHQPVVGIAATPTGLGYWLVDRVGRVHAFGDAVRLGDLSRERLPYPVVGMAVRPGGGGYWLATNDGRVASFGTAADHGSTRLPGA